MSMLDPSRMMLLIGLLTLLQGQTLSAAEACHSGTTQCLSGLTAVGGCYDPNAAKCQDGLICDSTLSICRRGRSVRGLASMPKNHFATRGGYDCVAHREALFFQRVESWPRCAEASSVHPNQA